MADEIKKPEGENPQPEQTPDAQSEQPEVTIDLAALAEGLKAQAEAAEKKAAIEKLLPVLDTLEMAANAPTGDENYKKGVVMTLDKCAEVF